MAEDLHTEPVLLDDEDASSLTDDVRYWFCPICGFNEDPNESSHYLAIDGVIRHILNAGRGHEEYQRKDDEFYMLGVDAKGDVVTLATADGRDMQLFEADGTAVPHQDDIPDHWKLKLTHRSISLENLEVAYWACPHCGEIDLDPSGEYLRHHISGRQDGGHEGASGQNPNSPIFGYDENHEPVAQMTPASAHVRSDRSIVVEVQEEEGRDSSVEHQRRYAAETADNPMFDPRVRVFNAWAVARTLEEELVPVFGADAEISVTDIEQVTGVHDLAFIERVRFETEAVSEELQESLTQADLRAQYREAFRSIIRTRKFGESTEQTVDRDEDVGLENPGVEQILEGLEGAGEVSDISGVPVRVMGEDGEHSDAELSTGDLEGASIDAVRAEVVKAIEVAEDTGADWDGAVGAARRRGMVEMGEFVLRLLDLYNEDAESLSDRTE